jgi:isopropylmalate/homocitrate/citramalate synthase
MMYRPKPWKSTFVVVNDTTLREQTAGVAFTLAEKLAITRALDAAGVPELEVGVPAIGEEKREGIRAHWSPAPPVGRCPPARASSASPRSPTRRVSTCTA